MSDQQSSNLAIRVIPCLDVTVGRVVKGVEFVNLRDAGDPVEMAEVYDAAGADEASRPVSCTGVSFMFSSDIGARLPEVGRGAPAQRHAAPTTYATSAILYCRDRFLYTVRRLTGTRGATGRRRGTGRVDSTSYHAYRR